MNLEQELRAAAAILRGWKGEMIMDAEHRAENAALLDRAADAAARDERRRIRARKRRYASLVEKI